MKQQTLEEIAESLYNGNITWVKNKIKRMSKRDFLEFVIICTSLYNYNIDDLFRVL